MSAPLIVIIFAVIVCTCAALSVFLFLGHEGPGPRDERAVSYSIAGLSSPKIHHVELLLGDSDYRQLCARLELKPLRKKLRRERRRIALLWLSESQSGVRLLWEFRRFLVANGLRVTLREEIVVGFLACIAIAYLQAVRVAVYTWGPFVSALAIRGSQAMTHRLSALGMGLLRRAPVAVRAQIAKKWEQHAMAVTLG